MGPLVIARTARKALKAWRELPDDERERVRADADRVRDLTAELARTRLPGAQTRERSGADVARELQDAVVCLGKAAGPQVLDGVKGESRVARMGVHVAGIGARRLRGDKRGDQS